MNNNLSRRKILLAGGAAAISPFLLSGEERVAGNGIVKIPTSGHAVSAVAGSEPAFRGAVEHLFPSLTSDSTFQQIAPLALLVTHKQGPPVQGFSVLWTITTPTGTHETPLYFYVSLGSPATGHTLSALGSARRNILRVGESRLVTPFFSWTPDYYAVNSVPDWNAALRSTHPGTDLISHLRLATEVKVSLDAAVFADWKLIGPNKYKLATKMRARRNAEHDAGLSLYKLMKHGASDSEIVRTLQVDGRAAKSNVTDLKTRWYDESRRFHAEILLNAFQNADRLTFKRALVRLTRQRKTLITRADA
jgi:hypothetical protein